MSTTAPDRALESKLKAARKKAADTKNKRTRDSLIHSAVQQAAGPRLDNPMTVKSMCEAARVSSTAFYNHFPQGVTELLGEVLYMSLAGAGRRISVDVDREKPGPEFAVMITVYRVVSELSKYSNLFNDLLVPREWIEEIAKPLKAVISHDGREPSEHPDSVIAEYHAMNIVTLLRREYAHDREYMAKLVCSQLLPVLGLADEEFDHKWRNVIDALSIDDD